MNAFISALNMARQNRWCTKPMCTTCGAVEFRTALRRRGETLADDLAQLDLDVLQRTPGWRDGLRLALDHLSSANLKDRVLSAWYPQLDEHVAVADFVLFYYIRRGALLAPMSITVLTSWRDRCIELALQTHDESLVESLIYTLGDRYREYPLLKAEVEQLTLTSSRVALAAKRQRNH